MKWIGPNSYIRVTQQHGTYFVHLVTERFLRKDSFLMRMTNDRASARTFALKEGAARQLKVRLED